MKKSLYFISALLTPVLTFAFSLGAGNDTTIGTTLAYITEVVDMAIPLLSALAFIVFFWGLSKFILNSNKQAELENGKTFMMWGILALFILWSFSAIIGYISGDLFDTTDVNPNSILLPEGKN